MEAEWVEHLDSLAERLRRNDPDLVHLQPYIPSPVASRQAVGASFHRASSLKSSNDNSDTDASTFSNTSRMWGLFHMMILLDDQAVQRALERLWEACDSCSSNNSNDSNVGGASQQQQEEQEQQLAEEQEQHQQQPVVTYNTTVRRVTLPAMWPCSDLRQALAACTHLHGLEELYIVPEQHENNYHDHRPAHAVLHASSPLHLDTEVLPLLQVAAERMHQQEQQQQEPQHQLEKLQLQEQHQLRQLQQVQEQLQMQEQHQLPSLPVAEPLQMLKAPPVSSFTYLGLLHLQIATRLLAGTQGDIVELGQVLTRLVHLRSLSLHLVVLPQQQQQRVLSTTTTTSTQNPWTLDPVVMAAADLSHPTRMGNENTVLGLQSLCLEWGEPNGRAGGSGPVVSVAALARLFHGSTSISSRNAQDDASSTSSSSSCTTTCACTLHTLRLQNCLLADDHLQVVATALAASRSSSLQSLHLSGHSGVTQEGLRAVRDVLEQRNFTLWHISLYTPREDYPANTNTATRRLVSMIRRSLIASQPLEDDFQQRNAAISRGFAADRSDYDNEEEQDYYRLQFEMEIFCRLNRFGRGALLSPQTTEREWIDTLAECCSVADGDDDRSAAFSFSRGSSSQTMGRRSDGLVDVGLNEIFILLRAHPSLCRIEHGDEDSSLQQCRRRHHRSSRHQRSNATSHPLASSPARENSFKNLVSPPPTSVSKAMAMQWRKQQKERRDSAHSTNYQQA